MRVQQYKFVDMTGSCFKSFQSIGEIVDGELSTSRRYHDRIGAMLRASNDDKHPFYVDDKMVLTDELIEAGFEWGVDFYVKKI